MLQKKKTPEEQLSEVETDNLYEKKIQSNDSKDDQTQENNRGTD